LKTLGAMFVAALFVVANTGLVFAQSPTTTPPKAEDKKMDKAGDAKADKKMASKNASGNVKSSSADSVVVAGKDKGKDAEWTFAVDSKTKIKKGGKDIMAGDLKAGDAVQVKYMEHGGKAVAQTITVKGGSTAKTDDKKPASSADKK
jgi:Domain of unknown function (DUF5666)